MAAEKAPKRYCLVTVGATVGFRKLTAAVLEPDFWRHLASHGFTELRVQCGPDEPWAAAKVESQRNDAPTSFSIEVFASRNNLLMEEMILCKASGDERAKGLIIGHAGESRRQIHISYGKLMRVQVRAQSWTRGGWTSP